MARRPAGLPRVPCSADGARVIFSADLMPSVLSGTKTETRRIVRYMPDGSVVPSWYKPGRRYPVQPGRTKRAVARVDVHEVTLERAGDITPEAAQREGFASVEEFVAYVASLWHMAEADAAERMVWAIRFELAEVLA